MTTALPSPEQLLSHPLDVVQAVVDNIVSVHGTEALQQPEEDWGVPAMVEQAIASDPTFLARIPSLNDDPTGDSIPPNALVRIRCMVREQMNPEMYEGMLQVASGHGDGRIVTGKYRDALPLHHDAQSHMLATYERLPLFCEAVPGESAWVQGMLKDRVAGPFPSSPAPGQAATSAKGSGKRRLGADAGLETVDAGSSGGDGATSMDADGGDEHMQVDSLSSSSTSVAAAAALAPAPAPATIEPDESSPKKRLMRDANDLGSSMDVDASDALDGGVLAMGAPPLQAIVKVYDSHASNVFKMCDVVEFVGVLCKDPALYGSGDGIDGDDDMGLGGFYMSEQEFSAQNPPSSTVHRVHCLTYRRVDHLGYMLVPSVETQAQEYGALLEHLMSNGPSIRESLKAYLMHVVGNDDAMAEMVILHMVSHTHGRRHGVPLGKLSLNMSNCSPQVAQSLAVLIQAALPKVGCQTVNVAELNSSPLTPTIDHDIGRLRTSWAQAAPATNVILDETSLDEGQLQAVGVKNSRLLQKIIEEQKLVYDFGGYEVEYDANMSVLIVSRSKSIFKTDAHVVLRDDAAASASVVNLPPIAPQLLAQWRQYLLMARQLPFSPPANMEALLNEFMESMRANGATPTEGILHFVMNALRLLAVSHLESDMQPGRWDQLLDLASRVMTTN